MASSITFSASDGVASHRPSTAIGYELAHRDYQAEYRAKVGKLIAPKLNGYRPGMSYTLKSLPDNYQLWQKHRKETPSAKAHVDRYLYGHPTNYIFRSVHEFAPHALWLASGMERKCACIGCTGKRTRTALMKEPAKDRAASLAAKSDLDTSIKGRVLREKYSATASVKESVFTKLLTDLKSQQEIHLSIQDPENLAFRIEQKNFTPTVSKIAEQGAFIPRASELVLFRVKVEDAQPSDSSNVEWRAGLVTETPHPSTLPLTLAHINEPSPSKTDLGLNYSGFRVETMTDPDSDRKDGQLQWRYLPLSALRPFNLHPLLLSSPSTAYDKSILNALKCSVSFSLALPLSFIGRWPNAWILHGGIYLGAELIVTGDAVQLLPATAPTSEAGEPNILVVTAIVLALKGLEADPPYYTRVTGDNCKSMDVRLYGRLYTTTITGIASTSSLSNDGKGMDADTDTPLPPAMLGSNTKYAPIAKDGTIHSAPLSQVLGRVYEADALRRWGLPMSSATSFTCIEGIISARTYARKNDERILALNQSLGHQAATRDDWSVDGNGPEEQHAAGGEGKGKAHWFWANDRVEALGLNTFGELDVGEQWEEFIGKERMAYEG